MSLEMTRDFFLRKTRAYILETRYLQDAKRALIGALVSFAFVGGIAYFYEILYSRTPSWPYSHFLHLKRVTPHKGDLTAFWHEMRGQKLIKKIIGVPGDKVTKDSEGVIWVNDQKIGKPFSFGSDGKSLHAIEPQTIPEGFVFVYSPHEQSFDSRYQEVGLIPISALMGKVIPLVRN